MNIVLLLTYFAWVISADSLTHKAPLFMEPQYLSEILRHLIRMRSRSVTSVTGRFISME
ncbi:hypothetical protein J6590_035848 [Homalodisca vitripennis]|nr:hypothetical protein J6590_035848 [Homalodisca vitripennis]